MLEKPKKKKPVSYYSKKADRVLQELGRKKFDKCEICGADMSCLHHYYPKSSAGNLRYNWLNLIPICQGCHFRHHNGFPEIHNTVNRLRGDNWLADLKKAKMTPIYNCNTKLYYEQKEKELKNELEKYDIKKN